MPVAAVVEKAVENINAQNVPEKPKRSPEQSAELKARIIEWALTPVALREFKTGLKFAKELGVSVEYVSRVSKTAPKDLKEARKYIRSVMISKAMGGDIAAARYVERLADREEAEKVVNRKESKDERIVREATNQLRNTAIASSKPSVSAIPSNTSLAETRVANKGSDEAMQQDGAEGRG